MAKVNKEFRCETCNFDFQKIVKHTIRSAKCKDCGTKCESLISSPSIAKVGGPRTVGSQIEQNNRKNPYTREKYMGSQEDAKATQEGKKINKLGRMSEQQKQRYIETGKMP